MLSAGAVQAAMLTADAAIFFEAGAQGLTGAVQTNREIVVRGLQILRNTFRRFTLEIDPPDELGIIRTQLWEETVEAGADGGFHFIERRLLIVSG